MNNLDTFNEFFDDVMNQKMSVHAFGMYAKGLVMNLQATIEAQEIIIKDMAQPKPDFVDTSCARCKNVNDCSLCENVKNETGMKLREMSFFCFEPKAQP